MNLNQVTLPAVDLAPAIAFYQRLGLRLIVEDLPDYARFECPDGDSTLSLERVRELIDGPRPVVYFECADLDQTVGRLRAAGIIFDSLPADQPWLWREARLRDPAGNPLCLFWAGRNRRHPPWRIGGGVMTYQVRRAEYFYTTVADEPGQALKLLTLLAEKGIGLLAFTAVPVGPNRTQLTLFPDDVPKTVSEAGKAQLPLDGPYAALLVEGQDALGALAGVHAKLYEANVNVYASSGVADGRGGYGYVIYVRGQDYDASLKALGVR